MINTQSTVPDSAQVSAQRHFIIGQDASGQWLALETHHQGGGLFKSRQTAIQFVEFETGHRADAYELSPTPIALTF